MRSLKEEFKRLEGQPVEIITESGFKFCGIDVESNDDSVKLVDKEGRFVRVENRHIEAVVEPQMRLKRICQNNDCECCDNDEDDRDNRHNGCDRG